MAFYQGVQPSALAAVPVFSAARQSSHNDVPVLLINRDKDKQRLAHMHEQARRIGVTLARVPAVEANHVPAFLRSQFFNAAVSCSNLLPGEIGCYASHLVCCRTIVENKLDYAIVLEDDVELRPDFMEMVAAIISYSEMDWDIVRLSSVPRGPIMSVRELDSDTHLVQYTRLPKLSGAQLWTRRGAEKFLRHRKRVRPVDADLRYAWESGLVTLGVYPPLANQFQGFESSIAGGVVHRRTLRGGRWKQITLASRLRGAADRMMQLGVAGMLNCALAFLRSVVETDKERAKRLLLTARHDRQINGSTRRKGPRGRNTYQPIAPAE